jgi:GT2 family glycosyltransferase
LRANIAVPRLAIIIVSWNVRDLLRRCLRAIDASLAGSDLDVRVLVVDNASHDGTPAMVRAEFPQVRLLEPGRNLGFVGGNNLALRALGFGAPAAPGAPRPADYVLLLNPDTEPRAAALPALVRALEERPQLVAVGPRLRYADGSVQSSRRRFPTRLTFFWESTPLERLWPGNPWARRYHCADLPDDQPHAVEWLVGAALLVRGAAIVRAGLLDERFFMYSEELEWQRRLQQASGGAAALYLPAAEIIHYEGRSSEQVPVVRHVQFQRSRLLLARLWYGAGFARLLSAFLWLGYVWELLNEAGKLLLGHRPDLRRRRIAVYAAVLDGLRRWNR